MSKKDVNPQSQPARPKFVKFDDLPLANDFLFGAVMQKIEPCEQLLSALFGEEIKIQKIEKQKDLSDTYRKHGIRLDILAIGKNGTVYNLEMQTTNNDNLGNRIRYYQAGLDRFTLDASHEYKDIKKSVIVFVCTFDYFKQGKAMYVRKSIIEGTDGSEIAYDDGTQVVILNSKYTDGNAPKEILEFLDIVEGKETCESELAQTIIKTIKTIKSDRKERSRYITMVDKLQEFYDEGHKAGHTVGRAEGHAEGHAEGLAEGLAEGERNTIFAIVRKCVGRGMSEPDIFGLCSDYPREIIVEAIRAAAHPKI